VGLLVSLLLSFLCSCSEQEADTQPVADVAVNFGVNMEDTRAGYVGELDLDALKRDITGFGVYAYHTGTNLWSSYGSATVWPNFMYNQHVVNTDVPTGEVDASGNALSVPMWTYEPVKYWPNGSGTANDDWGSGTNREYVTFFAYAPWVELNTSDLTVKNDPTTAPASGIVAINGSEMAAKNGQYAPTVDYKLSTTSDNVDLLWATPRLNLTKQRVDERVNLIFHHALSSMRVMVQRVYDEPLPGTGEHPDNATDTKLFLSSLTLSGIFYREGRLRLDDGTWTMLDASGVSKSFSFGSNDINDTISGTLSADAAIIQDVELDKWGRKWKRNGDGTTTLDADGTIVPGVIETPRLLHKNGTGFFFIPQEGVTLTPHLTYSFVTRDDALELNYLEDSGIGFDRPTVHRYSRITQSVTGDEINLGTLEAGKRYVLLCLIGVEHVSFEVISVEDWDFPIRFTPDLKDWNSSEPIEKVLNES